MMFIKVLIIGVTLAVLMAVAYLMLQYAILD